MTQVSWIDTTLPEEAVYGPRLTVVRQRVDWVSQLARDAIVAAGGRVYYDDKMQCIYEIPGMPWIKTGFPGGFNLLNGVSIAIVRMSHDRRGLVRMAGEDEQLVVAAREKWLLKTGQIREEEKAA